MRNREAARYARWAAITAGLIALAVGGVYAERAFRRARANRNAPMSVPVTVQQQSAQFSFSKVEQDRTIFTVRASHATQYKDQNRAVLEDVWITLYGRDGSRNDNIHTRECSYEGSQDVRCEGDVEIDLANANPASGKTAGQSGLLSTGTLEVKTSNLSFNRSTGEASTPAPVEFPEFVTIFAFVSMIPGPVKIMLRDKASGAVIASVPLLKVSGPAGAPNSPLADTEIIPPPEMPVPPE